MGGTLAASLAHRMFDGKIISNRASIGLEHVLNGQQLYTLYFNSKSLRVYKACLFSTKGIDVGYFKINMSCKVASNMDYCFLQSNENLH